MKTILKPEDVSHWSFSSWTRDTVHLAVAKADKLKSNYKNIQVQLLHNRPRSLPPPPCPPGDPQPHSLPPPVFILHSQLWVFLCVITQPTVIPCSRSSAVFFPWHSLHCSPVATLQRRLGEQQSNSPKGKQTIALNSFEWRESSETTGGTWNWIHGSVLYMLAHKCHKSDT